MQAGIMMGVEHSLLLQPSCGPGAVEQRGDLSIVGLGRGHQAGQHAGPDQLVRGVARGAMGPAGWWLSALTVPGRRDEMSENRCNETAL